MTDVQDRFENLKAMNTLVKSLNDELAYYDNWIYIIPDDVDDEELMSIAEDNDPEIYDAAVRCFIRIFKRYSKYGLYIGNKLYDEEN